MRVIKDETREFCLSPYWRPCRFCIWPPRRRPQPGALSLSRLRENGSRLTPFGGSVDLNRSQATADYPVSLQMKSHHGIDEEVRQMTMFSFESIQRFRAAPTAGAGSSTQLSGHARCGGWDGRGSPG
jgi:hypothetical protein